MMPRQAVASKAKLQLQEMLRENARFSGIDLGSSS